MAGLVPAIHVFLRQLQLRTWMPGSSPGMTKIAYFRHCERSEAIQSHKERLDCFVASAPRNDGNYDAAARFSLASGVI